MKRKLISLLVLLMFLSKIHCQSTNVTDGDSLFLLGNYSKAIEVYKNNNLEDVDEKIAEAYLGIGNYELALEYYKKGITSTPNNILVKYKYGKLLFKIKKYNEAQKVFKELIEIDDSNPNYHYELGIVLEHQENAKALNKFYKVFKLDSTHQKAIFKLAKNQLLKRVYDSVNYYANIGLKSYSNNIALINLKAQNYYHHKEYSKAIKWFQKLIALNESNQFIHEKLSSCYQNTNQLPLAIKHKLLALKFEEKNADNLYGLGLLYEQEEDYINAENFIEEAISVLKVPLDKKYLRLGYVQSQQQKYPEAIKSFQKAIKENDKNEDAHFYLIYIKDRYYKDFDIKLYDDFMKKFPKTKYKTTVKTRLKLYRKEKFLKGDKEA